MPTIPEGLLEGRKVSLAEVVDMDIKFASHEAEDLEAAGKSSIYLISYMEWLLGIIATLSQSSRKDDQIKLQHSSVRWLMPCPYDEELHHVICKCCPKEM